MFSWSGSKVILSVLTQTKNAHRSDSVGCYGIREKGSAAELLLAQPEPLDQRAVLVRIIALQVVEKLAALAHHLQQAAAPMKILDVGLEVLCQAGDAVR